MFTNIKWSDKASLEYSCELVRTTQQHLHSIWFAHISCNWWQSNETWLGLQNCVFLFVRPHWVKGCYQTGYVKNGKPIFKGAKSGPCRGGPPKGRKWFNVRVVVNGKRATAYLGRKKVLSFRTHFSPGGAYGALAANGYKNVVYFRRLSARRGKILKECLSWKVHNKSRMQYMLGRELVFLWCHMIDNTIGSGWE